MSKKDSENVCFWLPNQTVGRMDVLTPHKMMVVFLIQEYLRLKKPTTVDGSRDQQPQPPPPQPIELSAGDRKRFCMLLLKLIQYPDLPYRDLYSLLVSPVYGVHPVHLEEFNKLMHMLKSVGIDVLFDLYNEIDKLIMDNTASFQIGIVGLYLRKVFVTMDRMSFHEMKDLYLATITYYEKGMDESWPNLGYDCDSFMLAQNKYAPIEPSDHGQLAAKWSVKQSELFIAQQSALLRDNEVKALSPRELQKRLNEIIRDRHHCSQAYFLSYLNNVRVRDFNSALNALHRAFDRTPSASAAACAVAAPAATESKEYHYASLNLAILHAEFGHKRQARQCLRECIVLAQEYGDTNCLQLAHCWLAHLEQRLIPLPGKHMSLNLLHATCLRMLSFMRISAVHGSSPAHLFKLLMGVDLITCQRSLMDVTATSIAERTAFWTLYGRYEQASMCAQMLLNVDLKSLDLTYNGNGICPVLCTLIVRLAHMGEFGHALVVLQHTRARFPRYPASHDWLLTKHYVAALRAIYRGRYEEALIHSQCLHTYDANLAVLQLAHIAIARQDYVTGKHYIESLLKDDDLDPLTLVRAKILLANLYLLCNHEQVSLILNEAQVVARQHHLQYEDAMIDLHFGQLLLEYMHQPQQAFVAVKAGLETILANGPIYDQARATFLFARTIIAAERAGEPPQAKMLELVGTLVPMLEQAVEMFEKLECHGKAKDVWVFLARTYHTLGADDERNRYAYRFRVLNEQFHEGYRAYPRVFL